MLERLLNVAEIFGLLLICQFVIAAGVMSGIRWAVRGKGIIIKIKRVEEDDR